MTNRRQDVLLGLLFFSTLVGLGVVTVVLSDFRFGVVRHDVTFHSADVGFLRPGDPVLVWGMTAGKVVSIERLDRPQVLGPADAPTVCHVAIQARLDLDLRAELRRDQRIVIEDRGVLGGKLIRVEAGRADERHTGPLIAVASPSVIQAAGEILEENRADLRSTIENLSEVTAKAAAGQGPLGRLLNDEGLADRIDRMVSNLAELSDGLVAGEGTLGRLLTDSSLHDDAEAMLADLRQIAADLKSGEGTLGRLLTDGALYDEARSTLGEIRQAVSGVTDGDGLLAALFNDEQLADDVRSIVRQVLGAIEDARETAPVQSLGSFLFGTF